MIWHFSAKSQEAHRLMICGEFVKMSNITNFPHEM